MTECPRKRLRVLSAHPIVETTPSLRASFALMAIWRALRCDFPHLCESIVACTLRNFGHCAAYPTPAILQFRLKMKTLLHHHAAIDHCFETFYQTGNESNLLLSLETLFTTQEILQVYYSCYYYRFQVLTSVLMSKQFGDHLSNTPEKSARVGFLLRHFFR